MSASRFDRRALLGLAALSVLQTGRGSRVGAAEAPMLHVGDQRGAIRALLDAAGELQHVPYRIEWAFFPVGAPLVAALGAGAIDFGYVGDATTTFALASGARIKTINVWIFKGSSNALLVPGASPARGIADLRNKRVAFVRGSPGHLLVLAALQSENLSLRDIVPVPLAAAEARIALANGSVDAWAIWDPYAATAELRDHARALLTNDGLIEEVECGVAGLDAIAAKRPLLLDFIARVRRAYAWGEAHPEARAAAFTRDTGVPIDVSRLTFARQHVTVLPKVTDAAIRIHQHVADLYATAGIIPARIDVSAAYDRSFILPDAA